MGPASRRVVPRKSGIDEVNPLFAERRNGASVANPRARPKPAYRAAARRAPHPIGRAIGVDRIDSAKAEEENPPHRLKYRKFRNPEFGGSGARDIR